jgi:hypothetical protein
MSLTDELNDVFKDGIWNRTYFLRLSSHNIGSRQKNLTKQQDDQVTMTFLIPLLVVGKLEVLLPSEILPKWSPPEAYKTKFSFNNLFPKWGFKYGAILSVIILLVIVLVGSTYIFPFLKIFR